MRLNRASGCGLVLLGGVVGLAVFYLGWCWGLWLRDNLVLQSFFQCNCPAVSEAARYHPFRVLASACVEPVVRDVSPSGRYVLIREIKEDRNVLYDLLSNSQKEFTSLGYGRLFRENLVLMTSPTQAWVYDPAADTTTELPVVNVREEIGDDAVQRLELARRLAKYDPLYGTYGGLVGLAPDYQTHPEDNILVTYTDDDFIQLLRDQGVNLVIAVAEFPRRSRGSERKWYSADGRLYADRTGLYTAEGRQLVDVRGGRWLWRPERPTAWVANDRAVLYGFGLSDYVFPAESVIFHSWWAVPQPVLILDVPPEYWPAPAATPTP
jgi:hypothetical protein